MNNPTGLLRAMEKMWEPLEEEWAFTELLYKLEETCLKHRVGERDLAVMRYKCPVCKKVLKKEKI